VNDPQPSARKGGSGAVIAMGISLKKTKKSKAKQGTYTMATNPMRWSNTTP
jgi:hypothetical protein